MNFTALLARYEEYHRQQTWHRSPDSLYDPIAFVMGGKGKRFRPMLSMLSYSMYRSDIDSVLPLAFAYELFHNFSLVHDDIMDDAPLRRGKPTAYARYGTVQALLSGDLMLVEVYEYLRQMPAEHLPELLRVFNQSARMVCEGQQLDMDFEQLEAIGPEDYYRVIEGKTAALLASALQAGALAAGAPEQDHQNLYRFGLHMGRAFQIQDDYLDLYGNPEKVGKLPGGDILRNKKTILIVTALAMVDANERAELLRLYNASHEPQQKVTAVKAIFDELNLAQKVTELMQFEKEKALTHYLAVNVSEKKKSNLLEFTDQFISREF